MSVPKPPQRLTKLGPQLPKLSTCLKCSAYQKLVLKDGEPVARCVNPACGKTEAL